MKKIYKKLLAGLLFVLSTVCVHAQIAVTVTGNTNTTPNLATNYPSLAAALTDLNLVTAMSGPVVLTCTAGGSETAPPTGLTIGSATLNPVLSAVNTVTINKSGGTVTINAGVGTATPTSASPDGMISIRGADYITIDGLTLTDGNVTNPATMEFGIGLFKLSLSDGAQNNTIQNCNINVKNSNFATGTTPMIEGAVGILMINSVATAATTALSPTTAAGTNSNNKFYSNVIDGGNYGMGLIGFAGASPFTTCDTNNDIGGASLATGNTIRNFGGGSGSTNPSAGIRTLAQYGINFSYNTVNNNTGSNTNHPSTFRGIYLNTAVSASATVSNNTVTMNSGATTSQLAMIENVSGSTPSGNTININNNTLTGGYATATSGVCYGIYNQADPATLNINSNTVSNISYSTAANTGSGVLYPIYNTGGVSGTTINVTSNNVNNISRTGTTGGTTIGIFISGGVTGVIQNVNNNNVNNLSIDGAGTASILYGIQTTTSTLNCNNNVVRDLTCIKTTGTGAMYGIYNIASPTNETYNNNQVYNLTHNGTGTLYGLYANTATGTRTVSGNTIYAINGAGTTVAGITMALSSPIVSNNRIYNIQSTSSASPTVSGIIVSSVSAAGFATLQNNLIGDIKAPNAVSASGADNVRGINLTSTTASSAINVYYNTIYLNATSVGAQFSTSGIFHTASATSTTATLTMRNNIIFNTSVANGTGVTAAYRRSATNLANYGSLSNKNLFYAGTPSATNLIFVEGTATLTNPQQTISGYKTYVGGGRDAASVSENPLFQSTVGANANFLKYDVTVPLQCESGAENITGITTDYIGTIRQGNPGYTGTGTAPDMGAWELEGIAADLTGPSISYTPLPNTLCLSDRTLSPATITDASGVNITAGTRPRLYFKKSTNANTFVDNTNATDGWKYVEATGAGGSPFSFTTNYALLFGGIAAGDSVSYFVVAQDLAGTPNVGINSGTFAVTPTSVALTAAEFPLTGTINGYRILGGTLSGSVNVGPGETYLTLTGAGGLFSAINAGGLVGNLTANITGNITTEDGSNSLNVINYGCSGPYTLTIKPAASVTATVSGSSTAALIKLNGADYVTIDGSNNGSASRDLTIINTATAAPSVIGLISLGSGLGATNNTIKNCNLSTGVNSSVGYGIAIGGATPGTTGADNDNNTIQNNVFTEATAPIYAIGTSNTSTGGLDNLVISNNSISFNTSLNSVIGVRLGNALNAIVSNNNISIETSSAVIVGISLEAGFINSTVSRNLISKVKATAPSTIPVVRGIVVGTGQTGSNVSIVNNAIYNVISVYATTNVGSNCTGILLGATGVGTTYTVTTGGIDIQFNSINLFGNVDRSSATFEYGLFVGSNCSGLDVRNNVFSNSVININASGSGSKSYAIYSQAANTAYSNINYNDYYASGTQAVLGFLTSDRTTLIDWQTATGQDANSIATDPLFNSNTNLQPQTGSPLVAAGTPIAGITTDILGFTRNATTPTIGAYEQSGDLAAPIITYSPLNNTLCLTDRTLLPVTITDPGSGVNIAAGTRPRLYFKKATNANTFNDNTSATDGWKYVEATGVAGSPFSFTTNYLLLFGGIAVGDVIQYFVVAQDNATIPNVAINSGVFASTPASVALTAAAFPITGTIYQYSLLGGLATDVTIGAAGNYPTLTGTGGLFEAINAGGLLNNITARIIDAAITETGANSLTALNYGCVGTYTLTIKPDVGINTVLSGAGAPALINLDGADNITFDGSNNGTSSKNMTIRNTSTTGSTFRFINDATNITVKNTIIEGAITSTSNGIVLFSTSTGTTGNSNISILNNDIRDRSDLTATFGNAVYSSGTASALNATNTISGNNIFNFNSNGISLTATGIGDNWQISSNNIYNAQATASAVAQNGIVIAGGNGHTVSGNFVGGNAAGATGTWTNTGNIVLTGISITGGVTTISNNTIANITTTNTGATAKTRGIVNTSQGDGIVIDGNTIFNLASFGSVASYTSGSQPVMGIYSFPTTDFHLYIVSNNLIHDLSAENTSALTSSNLACGMILTNFKGAAFRNTIYNIRNKGTGVTAGQPPIAVGIYARFFDSGYVYNNMISIGEGETNNVQFSGIQVVGAGIAGNDQHYYYNSIRVGGTATGTFSSYGFVRGDNTTTSPGHPVELRNNIISMVRSGGGSVNYVIGSQGTAAAVDWSSDYNDLYNTTAANTGYWNATGYDLANWRTNSGGDANSIAVVPNFVSTTDLHLLVNNCGLDGYGTPLTGFTTDYDAQARDAGAPDMGADEFTATYGTTLAGVVGSAVCDSKNVSPAGSVYATSSCDLIARVLPSGGSAVSGKINVCVTLDATQQYFNGQPYLQRHHDVLPATNPATSTATISLYFTDAEFVAYNSNNPAWPPLPTAAGGGNTDPNRANVLVTEFYGTPTTTPSQPGSYTLGTRTVINPVDANITWNGNYWTVSFDITGSGGFYLHSNAFGTPLPISINYFTGVKQGTGHVLNWKVTCQSSARATMILERSADSRNFSAINSITADAARCNAPFSYTDAQPLAGMNYYRLKMIDDNGAVTYSSIVALLNAVKGFDIISIAPNPVTTGNLKLNVSSATASTIQLLITDMQGRTMSRQTIPVGAGFSSIPMDVSRLASGTYSIQAIVTGEPTKLMRFVKQ